jgi:hypothetical protein
MAPIVAVIGVALMKFVAAEFSISFGRLPRIRDVVLSIVLGGIPFCPGAVLDGCCTEYAHWSPYTLLFSSPTSSSSSSTNDTLAVGT